MNLNKIQHDMQTIIALWHSNGLFFKSYRLILIKSCCNYPGLIQCINLFSFGTISLFFSSNFSGHCFRMTVSIDIKFVRMPVLLTIYVLMNNILGLLLLFLVYKKFLFHFVSETCENRLCCQYYWNETNFACM